MVLTARGDPSAWGAPSDDQKEDAEKFSKGAVLGGSPVVSSQMVAGLMLTLMRDYQHH